MRVKLGLLKQEMIEWQLHHYFKKTLNSIVDKQKISWTETELCIRIILIYTIQYYSSNKRYVKLRCWMS